MENAEQHRFELPIAAGPRAAAYYRGRERSRLLIHTKVPTGFSGQGIASRLAEGSFELLRATGRKAILKCPFMVRFYVKHAAYIDVVAG